MLGFAPLADSTLADDEKVVGSAPPVDENNKNFAANGITAGPPAVGTSALECQHVLGAAGLATAPPVVATADISVPVALAANGIVTGAPGIGGVSYEAGSLGGFIHALQTSDDPENTADGYWFSDDGTKFFRNSQGSAFGADRYTLSTPFDISTATLIAPGTRFDPSNDALRAIKFQISSDGAKFYVLTREISSTIDQVTYRFATYGLSPAFDTSGTYTFQSAYQLSVIPKNTANDSILDAIVAGGYLYTVQPRSDGTIDFQKRSLTGALLSQTQLVNGGGFAPRIAPLVMDGSLRLYVNGDIYDDALNLLDTSSEILASGLLRNYLVRPDGLAILSPRLHEFDSNPQSVTIAQTGAAGALGVATAPPVLGSATLDQNHDIIADALLSAAPSLAQSPLAQEHSLGAEPLLSGAPELPAAVFQDHLLSPAGILASVLVPTAAFFQDHRTGSDSLSTGPPNLAATELGQDHAFDPSVLLAPAPALAQLNIAQDGQALGAKPLLSAAPSLAQSPLAQEHALGAEPLLSSAPELPAAFNRVVDIGSPAVWAPPATVAQPEFAQVHAFGSIVIRAASSVNDATIARREPHSFNDFDVTAPPARVVSSGIRQYVVLGEVSVLAAPARVPAAFYNLGLRRSVYPGGSANFARSDQSSVNSAVPVAHGSFNFARPT